MRKSIVLLAAAGLSAYSGAALAQPTAEPGFALEPFVSGVDTYGMVRTDGSNGFAPGLYIGTDDAILLLDEQGSLTEFAGGLPRIGGMAFSRGFGFASGLYAVEASASRIYRFNPDGTHEVFATLTAGNDVNLAELAFTTDAGGFDGALYATDAASAGGNPGRIFRVLPDATFAIVYQDNSTTNMGAAFLEDTDLGEAALVVADLSGGLEDNGGVWSFDASMQRTLVIDAAQSDLIDPVDVIGTTGPLFGDGLLVSDWTSRGVYTLSANGDLAPVATGFPFQFWAYDADLLLEPDGTALIADAGSDVIWRLAAESDCRPDINGDGSVDTLDFLAYLNLWSAGDPAADWDGSGTVNTIDFLAFLNDWTAGCG